jgi:hypothetical protein
LIFGLPRLNEIFDLSFSRSSNHRGQGKKATVVRPRIWRRELNNRFWRLSATPSERPELLTSAQRLLMKFAPVHTACVDCLGSSLSLVSH